MSDSVRSHRWQPTRLPPPWDCPGKNTGVGCHFLLQCMKVKSESEVVQSCPTLSDPMDYSLPGSSVHGICQARVLEWGAIVFSGNMYITICEIDHQSKFSAWNRALKAGALGQPWGMRCGGRWEGGLGWGTHVHPWLIHVNVCQNPLQYCKAIRLQLK